MINIIDPHLHLFNLKQGEYHWLKPENPPFWPNKSRIVKNYSETDLQLSAPLSLTGFVHIEAGFNNQYPTTELQWLQQHCTLPFKAIGYLDITRKDFADYFFAMQCLPCFAGIRDILDNNVIAVLGQQRSVENLQLMAKHDAIFEAQFDIAKPEDINKMIEVMTLIPDLKIIVNHAGSPSLPKPEASWLSGISQLSEQPNCYIKCSGWEMKDSHWQVPQIMPYLEHIIASFGDKRVMLASNFPVSELGTPYQHIWQNYLEALTQLLSTEQLTALHYNNAKRIYQL